MAGSIFQSVKIAAAQKQPRRAAKAISPAERPFGRQQVPNFEICEEKGAEKGMGKKLVSMHLSAITQKKSGEGEKENQQSRRRWTNASAGEFEV